MVDSLIVVVVCREDDVHPPLVKRPMKYLRVVDKGPTHSKSFTKRRTRASDLFERVLDAQLAAKERKSTWSRGSFFVVARLQKSQRGAWLEPWKCLSPEEE